MSETTRPEGIIPEEQPFDITAERSKLLEKLKRAHSDEAEIGRLRAENDRLSRLLRNLVQQLDARNKGHVDAPGHRHEIPGIWDSDNGELAGKSCAWCALWKEAKATVATPATANYPHGSLGEEVEERK